MPKSSRTRRASSRPAKRTAAAKRTSKTNRPTKRAAKKAAVLKKKPLAAKPLEKAKKAMARPSRGAASRKAAAPPARKKTTSGKTPAPVKSQKPTLTSARAKAASQKATPAATPRTRAARIPRQLPPDLVPTPPSSLDLDRSASAVRSGKREMAQHLHDHTESSPALTGGDVDANWELAYSSGDEAPGGDNPTPGQDVVEEIGRAIGIEYADNEELRGSDKVIERDRHRWELDPASADDYQDRAKNK
jgi:hypothetical protein